MKSRKFKTAEKVKGEKIETFNTEIEPEEWETQAVDEERDYLRSGNPRVYEELLELDRWFDLPEEAQEIELRLFESKVFNLLMLIFGIAKRLDVKESGWMKFTDEGWPLTIL